VNTEFGKKLFSHFVNDIICSYGSEANPTNPFFDPLENPAGITLSILSCGDHATIYNIYAGPCRAVHVDADFRFMRNLLTIIDANPQIQSPVCLLLSTFSLEYIHENLKQRMVEAMTI